LGAGERAEWVVRVYYLARVLSVMRVDLKVPEVIVKDLMGKQQHNA
jgi:hypothetical protein